MKSFLPKIFSKAAFLAFCCGLVTFAPACSKATLEKDNAVYDEDVVAKLNSPHFMEGDDSEEIPDVKKVILHYHNDDGKCGKDVTTLGSDGGRAFYIWSSGVDGIECMPDSVDHDGQDMQIEIDFSTEKFAPYGGKTSLLFIIKFRRVDDKNENWGGQSADIELSYLEFEPNENGVVEVWTMPATGSDINIYKTEAETKVDGVKLAEFVDWKTIRCTNTASSVTWELYAYDETYYKIDAKNRETKKASYLVKSGSGSGSSFDIKFKYNAHINIVYSIESLDANSTTGLKKTTFVTFDKLYDDARFAEYYTYSGKDLGVTYASDKTTFKVWAPTSANMNVLLYTSGATLDYGGSNRSSGYHMNYTGYGVWSLTIEGDLAGQYYTYQAFNSSGTQEAVDPYATSCGINGLRGYIYNEAITNPEGWDTLPVKWDGVEGLDIETPQQLSIYEVHIKDFTGDESWEGNSKRGTFNAFVESGTTLKGHPEVKTGYDHLNELGIKAVQLLPIFDHDNDETNEDDYNWGYNPLNYNCVEGSYSSDPFSGTSKVRELKNLVLKLSQTEAHTRVIMDVVFNHVSRASASSFTKLMPKYYFRYLANGEYANGSGCSNEVRSEGLMVRKFIVDSVCMWATKYKIKGFRFDLMGLIDTETMRAVKDALYEIDPDIYTYGEGWTSIDGYNGKEGTHGTFSGDVYSELYPSSKSPGVLGCFNDAGRDAIRGGNDSGWGSDSALPTWGYVSQGASDCSEETRGKVADMLWGIHTGKGGNPLQTINYASCHDNWTLFDQLYYTLGDSGSKPNLQRVVDGVISAEAFIMLSNSASVMLGGEEIFRTKELNDADRAEVSSATYENMYGHYTSHNSYNAPLTTNSFKWGNKVSITRDGNTVDTSKATATLAKAIKLHTSMPKIGWQDNFPYITTSAGKTIDNISWAGSEKGSSKPNTYNGCSGFQFDEYFIFFGGRNWGWIQFGDVPKSQKLFEFGENTFDNDNGTVNLGNYDANTGGVIVMYKRGQVMFMKKTVLLLFPFLVLAASGCFKKNKSSSVETSSVEESSTPSEEEKNQTYKFFIDYWHSDEPLYTMKWYQGKPLGFCPEECKLTDEDATDPAFPHFLGWSEYSSALDEEKLWDFETSSRLNSTVNLYGIWVSN